MADQAPLGAKVPRDGYPRQKACPVCRRAALTSRHVLQECKEVEHLRVKLGITAFMDGFALNGGGKEAAYYAYINGLDTKRSKIGVRDHLGRGAALKEFQDEWLECWTI
jgi:hypothetical protein